MQERNLDFRYIKARWVRSFYDRVRLLKDSTVKLAVKAGIEFSFRMNMLTCKKAGVNELHLTKDVDKHIKSQTQTNSFNHKSIDLNDLKAYKKHSTCIHYIKQREWFLKLVFWLGFGRNRSKLHIALPAPLKSLDSTEKGEKKKLRNEI